MSLIERFNHPTSFIATAQPPPGALHFAASTVHVAWIMDDECMDDLLDLLDPSATAARAAVMMKRPVKPGAAVHCKHAWTAVSRRQQHAVCSSNSAGRRQGQSSTPQDPTSAPSCQAVQLDP